MLAHVAGRLDESEQIFEQVCQEMRRHGAADADGMRILALSLLRFSQRRLAEMETELRQLYDRYPTVSGDLLTLCLLEQGALDEARRLRASAPAPRPDFFFCLLTAARAMADATLGDQAAAARRYTELLPYQGQLAGAATGAFVLVPTDLALGDLAALLGRHAAAEEHYRMALDVATRCGSPRWADDARARLSVRGNWSR
jgi:tetratricopeptide (TPR) repeat protein